MVLSVALLVLVDAFLFDIISLVYVLITVVYSTLVMVDAVLLAMVVLESTIFLSTIS